MKTFICSDLIGYTMHEAKTIEEAWAEAMTTPVPLDCYYAHDRLELREKLRADGYVSCYTSSRFDNMFEVKK